MDWPRLETSWWNLSVGAAATTVLAACGPTVFLDDETGSDSVGETETDSGPTVQPTTTTPGCNNGSECPSGHECIDNVCIPYDDYCGDGTAGCCYDYCCYDDCCYGECYYSECYSDQDCGPMGICNNEYGYGDCVEVETLPQCESGPELQSLDLPDVGFGFVTMAFVDANGDGMDDLVIGREGQAELHVGPGGGPSVPLPVPPGATVLDAASGDLDGDGDSDIVLGTAEGSLLVLANDGMGGLTLALDLPLGAPLIELTTLQWNGDGTLDVAGVSIDGYAVLQLGDGMGGFAASATLPTYSGVWSMARSSIVADGYDDLVVQDDVAGQIFLGDFSGDLTLDFQLPGPSPHGSRHLLAGNIDGGGVDDVLGVTSKEGWILLESWADAEFGPFFAGLDDPASFEGLLSMAELGDIDGNGVADAVVASGELLTFVYGGSSELVSCQTQYFVGQPVGALAVGDIDGNGRADVAIALDGDVAVLRSQ